MSTSMISAASRRASGWIQVAAMRPPPARSLSRPNRNARCKMNEERRHHGREQRVGRNGDDKRREQGLVQDLERDGNAEHARSPEEVVVEGARGCIVLGNEAARRALDREQAARDAVAEGGRCE